MILDTNALSGFLRGEARLIEQMKAAGYIAVPTVVLGEYRYGITKSTERKRLLVRLDRLEHIWDILVIDAATACNYAELRGIVERQGRPIPINDLWIAALARQHNLPVLSRDKHFDLVPGLRRVSW